MNPPVVGVPQTPTAAASKPRVPADAVPSQSEARALWPQSSQKMNKVRTISTAVRALRIQARCTGRALPTPHALPQYHNQGAIATPYKVKACSIVVGIRRDLSQLQLNMNYSTASI